MRLIHGTYNLPRTQSSSEYNVKVVPYRKTVHQRKSSDLFCVLWAKHHRHLYYDVIIIMIIIIIIIISIIIMKTFNSRSSHGHHGSKRHETGATRTLTCIARIHSTHLHQYRYNHGVRSASSSILNACWVFSCLCNPSNSDMDHRTFIVHKS